MTPQAIKTWFDTRGFDLADADCYLLSETVADLAPVLPTLSAEELGENLCTQMLPRFSAQKLLALTPEVRRGI